MSLKSTRIAILLLFITLLSAGCMSLAEDITPPPGYISPTRSASTATPADSGMAESAETQNQTVTYPVIPPNPENGAAIYTEKCAPCHGSNGMGDGPQASGLPNPVAALGDPDVAREASPAAWYDIVTNGNIERFMPPFTSLSDRQRWDVVAYAFTLSVDDETLAAGETVFNDRCAECHGVQGRGGDNADAKVFIDQSQMAYESHNSLFQDFPDVSEHTELGTITDGDAHNALEYIRRLSFTQPPQEEEVAAYPYPEPEDSTAAAQTDDEPAATTQEVAAEPAAEELAEVAEGTVTIDVLRPSGDPLPEGLPVTVRGYDHMTEIYSQTATLNDEGYAEMTNVPIPPGRILLATVDFEQATYGSNVYVIEEGDEAVNLAISVYETTTDVSGISVDRLHVFFDFLQEDVIQVVELFVISNPGEKTIIAEEAGMPVLEFSLPPEATNLTFSDGVLGDRYIETDRGFADTVNIRPGSGQYQVMFGYDIPYPRNKADLQIPIELPTSSVIVMAPEEGVKIKSDELSFDESRQLEGITYQLLSSQMMQPGDTLDVEVSGWPKIDTGAVANPANNTQNLLIGVGVFGGVLILVGLFLWQRNRTRGDDWDAGEPPIEASNGPESSDDLIDAIIALDELYASGELPEDAYLSRRADLKSRLNDILEHEAE